MPRQDKYKENHIHIFGRTAERQRQRETLKKQRKRNITFKIVTTITDLSIEMRDTRKMEDIFQVLKDNNCQLRMIYLTKILFKNKWK